ncbi:casein kinase I-like [Drosophila tropicalis]|uniref:casein kinase I-like n=1 Tax=Drosophila tropicalis TaxID=46794 RepID=UPI0035ABDF74
MNKIYQEKMFEDFRTKCGKVCLGRFVLMKKIGSGSFGDVYLARDTKSNLPCAVKVERKSLKYEETLSNEYKMYLRLNKEVGFAKVYDFGNEKHFRWISLELLGSSICDLRKRCCRRLTAKTVFMLADQLLARIESLHKEGFIHRDIKPANMMMGLCGRSSLRLYLADLGLATPYINLATGAHIEFQPSVLAGTMTYCSINGMKRYTQSRRDDIESIGYNLICMAKGKLPWEGHDNGTSAKAARRILAMKETISLEELCKGLPKPFLTFMEYAKALQFTDEPDYVMLRRLFRAEFRDSGFEYDFQYDWISRDKHDRLMHRRVKKCLGRKNSQYQ